MLNFLAETFRLGLKNLHLHKLRSLLTALGIILGVAAVGALPHNVAFEAGCGLVFVEPPLTIRVTEKEG